MIDKDYQIEICNGCKFLWFGASKCGKDHKHPRSLDSFTKSTGFVGYIKPRDCNEQPDK